MSLNLFYPSSSSPDVPVNSCANSTAAIIYSSFFITRAALLLPLCIFVLYLGHQQWQQQRSSPTTRHSDIITYHVAALELIWGLGSAFYLYGTYNDLPEMTIMGYCLSSMTFCGETFFHLLTCVERYLAVVHPITYLGLRKERGTRIRNISIGFAWLLCFGWMGITILYYPNLPSIPFFCALVLALVVISFCSLSVLCVLIRPGPGDVGRDKEQVDQSKQRAFFTIVTIMAVLYLWFGWLLLSIALNASPLLSSSVSCVVGSTAIWFNLPCSLVLPLLYLRRAVKLPCCCHNS